MQKARLPQPASYRDASDQAMLSHCIKRPAPVGVARHCPSGCALYLAVPSCQRPRTATGNAAAKGYSIRPNPHCRRSPNKSEPEARYVASDNSQRT